MSAPEIRCRECEWDGDFGDLVGRSPGNPEAVSCPSCNAHAGPDGCMDLIEDLAAAAPNLIDAALASSSAIDRKAPQKDMRVPTWEEREAERKRVAERIATMWETLS